MTTGTTRRAIAFHSAWAAWANEHAFATDRHEDRFLGTLEGVEVRIEDGLRGDSFYRVEARIHLAGNERPGRVRPAEAREDDTPRLRALQRFVEAEKLALVIEPGALLVRFGPEMPPDQAEKIILAVIDAWRTAADSQAPYR